MAVTVGQVFARSMHLMDEAQLATGSVDTAENRGYKIQTPAIVRVLREECRPYSRVGGQTGGTQPDSPELTDFDSEIGLEDSLCTGVLPYGLAAHLLLDEDPDRAAYFSQRYAQLLLALGRAVPREFEEICPPYGGVEMGEFSHW